MPSGIGNRLISASAFGVLSVAAKMATRVTSYSSDYAGQSPLLRGLGHKLACVPPPVEIPEPSTQGSEELRSRLGLGARRVIGIAGRWVEEKGFDVLLDALPLLLCTHPDLQVVYAGEPPLYERFFERCRPAIQRAGDRFTFLGLIQDRQAMADFYRLSTVFALPSRSDMFALVQAEALLCGTPVVATDIPGARVAIRDTGAGVLVEPGNPAALADGIRSVLGAPEQYRPDPANMRQAFDPSRSLDLYETLLAEMAKT